MIPAQARARQEAKPETCALFTAPPSSASLRLCTALLLVIFNLGKCAAAENAGGLGPSPRSPGYAADWKRASEQPSLSVLAELLPAQVTPTEIGLLLMGLTTLAVIYTKLSGAEAALTKKVTAAVITQVGTEKAKAAASAFPQPLQVEGVVRFVAHHELDERLTDYVTNEELHIAERRIEDKLELNFRALDDKRAENIHDLHGHLTGAVKDLTAKIESFDARTHDRIEAMSNTLRGEFEAKLQTVRNDITELPGRLLTLLQQTGQIGSNHRGGKS